MIIDFIDRKLDNYVYKEEERNTFQMVAKLLNILKYKGNSIIYIIPCFVVSF